ncbi:MAG: hypothetical protein WAM66_10150 [Acidobacteriaceae bacterium]
MRGSAEQEAADSGAIEETAMSSTAHLIGVPADEEIALPEENRSEALYDDRPLRRLLAALPAPIRRGFTRLRRARRPWLRVSLGILLTLGGLLSFLPLLGLWMLPLGILLLAEDLRFLRRPAMRMLGAVQSWWDRRRERRRLREQ